MTANLPRKKASFKEAFPKGLNQRPSTNSSCRRPLKDHFGFTLLEVMVVLAIMAGLVAVIAPSINNQNNELKAVVRRFSVLTRQIRNSARLQNVTYRLVIDMKDGAESEEAHEYWVEKSGHQVLLSKERIEEELENQDEEPDPDEDKKPDPGGFEIDGKMLKGKKALPRGMIFSQIELATLDRPIEAGLAYIHFLPQGLVEESAIHINAGENLNWTLTVHPLTGRTDIVTKEMSLKDIRSQ